MQYLLAVAEGQSIQHLAHQCLRQGWGRSTTLGVLQSFMEPGHIVLNILKYQIEIASVAVICENCTDTLSVPFSRIQFVAELNHSCFE